MSDTYPNDVGGISGYKEMLRVIKEEPDGEETREYYTRPRIKCG